MDCDAKQLYKINLCPFHEVEFLWSLPNREILRLLWNQRLLPPSPSQQSESLPCYSKKKFNLFSPAQIGIRTLSWAFMRVCELQTICHLVAIGLLQL